MPFITQSLPKSVAPRAKRWVLINGGISAKPSSTITHCLSLREQAITREAYIRAIGIGILLGTVLVVAWCAIS